jgi:ATP citrate (pro-S)-lyase
MVAQNMLDFDFICGRAKPSVAGMVYPFTANHLQKFYWNTQEILLPIYQHLEEVRLVPGDSSAQFCC